jgi:hypothetical protein
VAIELVALTFVNAEALHVHVGGAAQGKVDQVIKAVVGRGAEQAKALPAGAKVAGPPCPALCAYVHVGKHCFLDGTSMPRSL